MQSSDRIYTWLAYITVWVGTLGGLLLMFITS